MQALAVGANAPEIDLSYIDGSEFSLAEARKRGPVVAAFFKVSCPVCQMAFPYLERVFKAYGQTGKFTFVGISQDNAKDTGAFCRQFGVSFPMLLDGKKYPASNAYGLTSVPTVFLISPAGKIEFSSVSWSKADVEELGRRLASVNQVPPAKIFTDGDKVPDFKPG